MKITRTQSFSISYAVLLAGGVLFINRDFYDDDAYITLRYARNFIDGLGIVWNPGERVQGYTNFLHLILVALLGRLGMDLVSASQLIGWAAYVGLVACVAWFARGLENDERVPVWHVPVILVASSTPLLVWVLGGLEGVLCAFLVTAGCLLVVVAAGSARSRRLYALGGLVLGLAYLTRQDAAIFSVAAGAYLCWLIFRRRAGLVDLIVLAASSAAVILPYTFWQFSYYGDIVPITFYAKAGIPEWIKIRFGAGYLLKYLLEPPFLALIMSFLLVAALLKRRWNAQLSFLSISVYAYLLYLLVGAGGDHMPALRLALPVIPLTCVVLVLLLPRVFDLSNPKIVNYITFLALVLASFQLVDPQLNPTLGDSPALVGTVVGKYIATAWPAGSVVALNTAGSTPYFAGANIYIDMLGLNDPTIARRQIEALSVPGQWLPGHMKGDGAYVLSREPDYIIIGPAQGSLATNPFFLSDAELVTDPRFLQGYALVQVSLDDTGRADPAGRTLFTYYKRTPAK